MGIRAGKSIRARSIPDDGRNQRSQAEVADKQRSRGWQYHSDQRRGLSRELRRTPSGFSWSPHWCEYGCLLNSGIGLRPGICHTDRHCKRYRAQSYQQWSDTSTRYWHCSRRRARLGIEGVIIARIRPGSPAERALLRAMDASTESLGDVITAANGEPVRSVYDLTKQLEHTGIGRTIRLRISRNGNLIDVEVEIVDINRKS